MKILAVGDLIGEGSIPKLKKDLENIQIAENIDFTIVNGENISQGMGMTTKAFNELCKLKIDAITMGNHTWAKKDIFSFIDNPIIIRPANYSNNVPGHGYTIFEKENKKIAVISLIGRVEINVLSENPFLCIDEILNKIEADIIIVDFHAEATGEKLSMGNYVDGRVTAMFGTHTHVPTADEQILKNGTGYITDIGMTGPVNSILGMSKDVAMKRMVTSLPERYKVAEGEYILNGIVFDIDDTTNKVKKLYRISL